MNLLFGRSQLFLQVHELLLALICIDFIFGARWDVWRWLGLDGLRALKGSCILQLALVWKSPWLLLLLSRLGWIKVYVWIPIIGIHGGEP